MQRVRHRFLAVRCSDDSVPVHREDLCKEEARVVIVIDDQDSEGGHVARSYIGRRTWARKTYRGIHRGTRKACFEGGAGAARGHREARRSQGPAPLRGAVDLGASLWLEALP